MGEIINFIIYFGANCNINACKYIVYWHRNGKQPVHRKKYIAVVSAQSDQQMINKIIRELGYFSIGEQRRLRRDCGDPAKAERRQRPGINTISLMPDPEYHMGK